MRARRKILRPGKDALSIAKEAGLGDPLFFIDGSSFDITENTCTDRVSGVEGTLHGSVTMVTGPSGRVSPLFNNARVDFGFIDPITEETDNLVCLASIRITPGFASSRTIVSMDNGTVASRIWRFGLGSTGQYFSQFRAASGSRGGTQSYLTATVEPRALVDKGAVYGMYLSNKTLQQEIDYPNTTNILEAYGPHPSFRYAGGNSFLRLQSISQSRLVVGAALNSSNNPVEPFYGVIEWLGIWSSRVRGQGEFLNLCQNLLRPYGVTTKGFNVLPELHSRTFYVDFAKWKNPDSFSSMTNLYDERNTQVGLPPGSLYSVRQGSGANEILLYYGEVVGTKFHTPANKSTARTANYYRPTYVGDFSSLTNSDIGYGGQATYGKMLRDLTGLSPATPSPTLSGISQLVRPGDKVLLSRRYTDDANSLPTDTSGDILRIGHVTFPTTSTHHFEKLTPFYPAVVIGTYDPETGVEIVPEENGWGIDRPVSQATHVSPENGVFYVSPVAGLAVVANKCRVSSWMLDTRAGGMRMTDSNASMYGLSSYPQNVRYTYPTTNTYPGILGRNRANRQSEGGEPVRLYRSVAHLHNFTMYPVQVPVSMLRAKAVMRHSHIMDTPGLVTDSTGMVTNEEAPGGSVLEMFGCYIGTKTNPVNNTGPDANTSRTIGTYIIRNISVHHSSGAYQMGRARLQMENSTLAYPLSLVGKEPYGVPYSIRQNDRYVANNFYSMRVRDPARSHYYLEWKFFWDGAKTNVTFEYEILSTVHSVFDPDDFVFPISVYYTDTGGVFRIYRDDENQHMGQNTERDFHFVETNTNDRWHRDPIIPSPANHRSGKRVLVLSDVGRGSVRFRISPFTRVAGVYLSPIIEVS